MYALKTLNGSDLSPEMLFAQLRAAWRAAGGSEDSRRGGCSAETSLNKVKDN